MIIEITIALNVSSSAKRRFVVDYLIPTLHEYIPLQYYFTWKIFSIPCLVISTARSYEQAQVLTSELQHQVDEFRSTLNTQEAQGSLVYSERWKDLRKMNGLPREEHVPVNFSVTWKQVEEIVRNGEYIAQIERNLYNEHLYRVQPLIEDSLRLLSSKGKSLEVPFLVGLFYVASIQLDRRSELKGYQSFKSHMIAFLSYDHVDMKLYVRDFSRYMQLNRDMFAIFLEQIKNDTQDENHQIIGLLRRWEAEFSEIFDEHQRARLGGFWVNPYRAMRYRIAQYRFREMSTFHKVAFSKKSPLMESYEFSTYRMLVNFIYLLLPAMGISSRKRVQASYVLTAMIEGDVNFEDTLH